MAPLQGRPPSPPQNRTITLLAGTLENQGTVRVLAGLRVQGALRNQGLVETVGCQVEAEGDGTITGNPAQPAAE